MFFGKEIHVSSQGESDIIDVTAAVEAVVEESSVSDGLATVFVPGATASVTTIEYEPGLVRDLKDALEKIAPRGRTYAHDEAWGDGNGFSHVRASLMGPSLSLPVRRGRLVRGTWQQVVVVDHDNRPRQRTVLIQVMGEK